VYCVANLGGGRIEIEAVVDVLARFGQVSLTPPLFIYIQSVLRKSPSGEVSNIDRPSYLQFSQSP
jgi:hypothetical protein